MGLNEFGNSEKDKASGFKKYIESEVLKDQKVEVLEFTKSNIRRFVNSEWRAINEKYLGGRKGVQKLQQVLRQLELYTGEDDGKFGVETLAALINFQKLHDIKTDGIAGPDVQKKLEEAVKGVPLPPARKDRVEPVIATEGVQGVSVKAEVIETAPQFSRTEKSIRTALGMGDKDTLEVDQQGDYLIVKENNTRIKIDAEKDIDKYLYAERLMNLKTRKIETLKQLKKLGDEEKYSFQENLGFTGDDIDGKIGNTTYQRYLSEEFKGLRSVFTAEEIALLKRTGKTNFQDFATGMGLTDVGEKVNIGTGDYIYEDAESGSIIVFNQETQELRILKMSENLTSYFEFVNFEKQYLNLPHEQQLKIQNLILAVSGSKGPLNIIQIFKDIKQRGLILDMEELANMVVYKKGEVPDEFITNLETVGISKKNIDDLNIPQGTFLTIGNEDGEPVLLMRGLEKSITRKEVLEATLLKGQMGDNNKPEFINLVDTLSKSGNKEKLTTSIKILIQSNPAKAQAIFAPSIQVGTDQVYNINFHGSAYLESILTAYDIFSNKDYISLGDKTYRRSEKDFIEKKSLADELENTNRSEWAAKITKVLNGINDVPPKGDFFNLNGGRLIIKQGTALRDTTEGEKDKFRQEITFDKLFDIYQTILNRPSRDIKKIASELKNFTGFMRGIIAETKIFSQVRDKFGIKQDENGKFSLKFPNEFFAQHFTAYELFGDQFAIQDDFGNTYYRNDALKGFYTELGERLAIGEKNDKSVTGIKNSIAYSQINLDSISKYVSSNEVDFEGLQKYLLSLPEQKKTKVIAYLRATLYDGKMSSILRATLAQNRGNDGRLYIDFSKYPGLKGIITPELLFGDVEFLKTTKGEGKDVYYKVSAEGVVEIPGRKKISDIDGMAFDIIGKEKLPKGLLSPEGMDAKKIGFPIFGRKRDTDGRLVTTCGKSAYEFATKLGASGIENNYAFGIFNDYSGASDRKLGNLKGKVSESQVTEHMTNFGSNVGLIFSDASPKNRRYGHIATIVYVKDKAGNSIPMVYDNYYGSGKYGKAETLASYMSHRAPIRGIIALES